MPEETMERIKCYWSKRRKQITNDRRGENQEIWKNAKDLKAALPVTSVSVTVNVTQRSGEGQLFSVESTAGRL